MSYSSLAEAIDTLSRLIIQQQELVKGVCENASAEGRDIHWEIERDRANSFALGVFASILTKDNPSEGKKLQEALDTFSNR